MMSRSGPQTVLLFLLFIYLTASLESSSGVGEPKFRCKEAERRALLKIKEDLNELQVGVLSSWGEEDEKRECCNWTGIWCDNKSGHVIKLDLSPSTFDTYDNLEGNISSSLVDLQLLNYLDLSFIDFNESSIPSVIGSLSILGYLNLSHTSLIGEIPPQLGNLSSLQFLDLSYTDLNVKNLGYWVSRLSSLRLLDLSSTNMSLANDWVHAVNNLPFLTELLLSGCNLPDIVPPSSLSIVNSSKVLRVLDLSLNSLSASIFQSLFDFNRSLVHLDLSDCLLVGFIPKGFKNMAALTYLDLSFNNFEGFIPESFGNMISLTYLDLCSNQLRGLHPKSFENMTVLTYLDLRINLLKSSIPESFENMTALTYLDLHSNKFEGSIPESFGSMIALKYLHLGYNQLKGSIPESFGSMIALEYLDLSSNQLKGSIPESFGSMIALKYLYLRDNQFQGLISEYFGNMTSLEYLVLSNNRLEGEIPKSIWKICTLKKFQAFNNTLSGQLQLAESSSRSCANFSLEYLDLTQNQIMGLLPNFTLYPSLIALDLSSNKFTGNVSKSLGQLSQLEILDISRNFIDGEMSEAHFSKLFQLTYLDLSSNSDMVLNIPFNWIPPFRLAQILLGSCKLGPQFPRWLQNQKSYFELNISNSRISDSIPSWFWINLPTELNSVDLSNNEISGTIHDIKQRVNNYQIDLSSNQLEGPIPSFLFQVAALNLFNNSFSELNSLCNVTDDMSLSFLDVSYNQLSGELPNCWSSYTRLNILVLENNKFSGKIPTSIGFLGSITVLHLGKNNLTGELPSSLKNCTKLKVLDVGENKLSGPIPTWIGTSLELLVILSLRSNEFNGSTPLELCHLQDLKVLDLSSNHLWSKIPNCLANFTEMTKIGSEYSTVLEKLFLGRRYSYRSDKQYLQYEYYVKLLVMWKGAKSEFINNLGLVKMIDLSNNKLSGEIPNEITKLAGLIFLNLSRNSLSGQIPQEIGELQSLDALDISKNHLTGQIPSSLSQVYRLNTLDLSDNNLSGKIPTSPQLQTRDAAAFTGNSELCGAPLPKKCPDEEEPTTSGATKDTNHQEDEDEFISKGFYISTALGFVVGFWGVCGSLIFIKSWRYAYFKLLNNAWDLIYVTAKVNKAKLLRMIKS